jgi:hypothetical protein
MVKERCLDNAHSCLKDDTTVEALVSVGDELLTFLRGTDDNDFHPCSYTRQSSYEVENLTSSPRSAKSTYLNRAECNSITNTAKAIMGWLLDITIHPGPDLFGLTFKALLESNRGSDKDTMKLGDLLQNHPGLLSLNTGFFTVPDPILRRPDDELVDEYSDDEGFEVNSPPTASSIIEWFPAVQSLLEQIQPRCSCSACKTKAKLDHCKRGCLREAAATRLFILLAHGKSEEFGAQVVSGRSNPEDQVTGVTKFACGNPPATIHPVGHVVCACRLHRGWNIVGCFLTTKMTMGVHHGPLFSMGVSSRWGPDLILGRRPKSEGVSGSWLWREISKVFQTMQVSCGQLSR